MKKSYRITRPGGEPYYTGSIAWTRNLPPDTEVWEMTWRGQRIVDVRQLPVVCGVPVADPNADLDLLERLWSQPVTQKKSYRNRLAAMPIICRLLRGILWITSWTH